MTELQKLKENRKILKRLEAELLTFRDESRDIHPRYLGLFPNKTPEEVRTAMIKAREADIVNYKHIIAHYETKLSQRGS